MQRNVVIVGGGVMGSAIAYFLASNSDYSGSIAVVERDPTYANCATTRSVGSIRQQFSTPENVRISQFGYQFISHCKESLSVDDCIAEIDLIESAYLVLATDAGVRELRSGHDVQTRCGASVEYLEAPALAQRFPWLNTDGLAAGCRGLKSEGWFDPYSLLMAFKRKAVSLGVEFLEEEVVAATRSTNRITDVIFRSGDRILCEFVVNAAGPYAGDFATMTNIELPVSPRRRNVFVIDCPVRIENMPLLVDPSGFYVRPEGTGYLCGYSPGDGEDDPVDYSLDVDHDLFEAVLWPQLANRIAAFETVRVVNFWAGHYDYNSFDQNGVVGAHPEICNCFFANGFSGHGLQQAPAVGRAISELLVYGEYRSLDLSNLGYDRLLNNRSYCENVII